MENFQARIYEGYEPLQFFVIFQSFIVFKVCGRAKVSYSHIFFVFV